MITSMQDCGPLLTNQDVDDLETRLGMPLPTAYRKFLLRYNGGRPTPRVFPIHGLTNNPYGVIQVFFRIGGEIESSTIDWNRKIMLDRLPKDLLPIACDDTGDLICLKIGSDDQSAVLFWDCHHDVKDPCQQHLYMVAKSFPMFIEAIGAGTRVE